MAMFGIKFVFVAILISLFETSNAETASPAIRRLQTKMDFFEVTVVEIKQSIRDLRDEVSRIQLQNTTTTTTCDPAVCETSQQADWYAVGSVEAVIEELESRITTVLQGFREEKYGVRKRLEVTEKYIDIVRREANVMKNELDEKYESNFNETIDKIGHVNETLHEYCKEILVEYRQDVDGLKNDVDEMKNDFNEKYKGALNETIGKLTHADKTLYENFADMTDRHDRLSEDLDNVKSEVTTVTKGQQETRDLRQRVHMKMWKLMQWSDVKIYGTSLYIFHSEKMTWKQSQQKCQEEMFHLAEINDADEYKFVRTLTGPTMAWLGATDADNEGTWTWLNSGSDVLASLWSKGQPDNWRKNEHCLHDYAPHKVGFNDGDCENNMSSVCELEM